jgi:hypothetical protein
LSGVSRALRNALVDHAIALVRQRFPEVAITRDDLLGVRKLADPERPWLWIGRRRGSRCGLRGHATACPTGLDPSEREAVLFVLAETVCKAPDF